MFVLLGILAVFTDEVTILLINFDCVWKLEVSHEVELIQPFLVFFDTPQLLLLSSISVIFIVDDLFLLFLKPGDDLILNLLWQ